MTSFPPPDASGAPGPPPYGQQPLEPPYAGPPASYDGGGTYDAPPAPYAGPPAPYGATPSPYDSPPPPYGAPPPYGSAPPPYGSAPPFGPPGYPPASAYGQGSAGGYPVVTGPGQNGLGLAGMITGIAGLILCWIPFFGPVVALVGAVLSGVALPQSKKRQQSTGFAVAGLVCGAVGALLGIAYIVYIFYEVANSYDPYYS